MILKTYKSERIRNKFIEEINCLYDNKDSGISGVLSALSDFRDYVIILFDNKKIMGAASYYLSNKNNCIEVDHIGVIKSKCGYGTILMNGIFKLAIKLNRYPVSVVSNGYANDFYEKIGMERINMKLPAIYEWKRS